MAVDYKELDAVLDMMGTTKDTRPLSKTKRRPKIKIKNIGTKGTKKTSFLPHTIVDNKKKNV